MALKVLYNGGWRDSLSTLRESDFTRSNVPGVWVNSTLESGGVPLVASGVLAGQIAWVTDSNEVGSITTSDAAVEDHQIKGIFVLDVASSPFENQPALGSGKVAVLSGRCVVEVDVYETHSEALAAQTYAAGDPLYASNRGLLTKVAVDSAQVTIPAPGNSKIIGVVRTAPADNNGKLVAELFL